MTIATETTGLKARSETALVNLRNRWVSIPADRRRLLIVCLVALLGLSAVSTWWSLRTDWRTLFSGLDGRDAAALQQQLSASGISYRTTPDGTALQVPAEELDKARVAISAGGLPQSGRLGFELFDKPNWIGSEFDEKVNYQRALEGELEHTVATLGSVRSARVHVVLPKQGAFASEDQPAKASVVLKLRRANLPREESQAIRNLIAGAVESLRPDAVTLVDADGRADLSPPTRGSNDLEEERALQMKLIQVLEPMAGAGNVHATVSIAYLETSEEHTDEVYDPQSATAVSTQRTEQTSNVLRPSGVAGASSNSPALQAAANTSAQPSPSASPAPLPSASAFTQSAQGQTSREENSSYAVSRHVTHTQEAPGRIRRLTAAVVINDRKIEQMSGKRIHTAWQHRTPEEMKQLQQLAEASVGFDSARGDQVVLENFAFSGNSDMPPTGGMRRSLETFLDVLRTYPTLPRALATTLGVFLLGIFVLRPLAGQTRQLLTPPPAQPLLTAPSPSGIGESLDAGSAASAAPALSTQQVYERVTAGIRTEPQSSMRLIGSWIGAGEEND
jgi:flagellar M-ring protein FliF